MVEGGAVTRRAFLVAAVLIPVVGCSAKSNQIADAGPSKVGGGDPSDLLVELEGRYDARLGVYASSSNTGRVVEYRADERFAFCSTFKTLAVAAVLGKYPLSYLDTVVHYTAADLQSYAPIAEQKLDTGMTDGELCSAAVQYSDNTAANLLLQMLGGPSAVNAYLRSIGDDVTRLDRIEPELNTAIPGDDRDTTSPRAIGTDYERLVLGDALTPDKREVLADWLRGNTTGAEQIRAGVPQGWTVADKTGSGDYGTSNDVGVAWTDTSDAVTISILTTRSDRDDAADKAIIADATRLVVSALT
ncbi:class A beta-lactamase [Rhodococcus erythropolis]|uniref:class A beta-lactamase n=1 Tax=Rhodococcus erythropolis TaxID=1833 RepID=UPI0036DB7394